MATSNRSGNAIIEVTLMAPWMLFLFVGILDIGFYCYALVCTQNAARIAAISNSVSVDTASDNPGNRATTCTLLVNEMNSLPNMHLTAPDIYACSDSPTKDHPIALKMSAETEPDGSIAAVVTVSYMCIPMIPIPALLGGNLTISRTATVPILNLVPGS